MTTFPHLRIRILEAMEVIEKSKTGCLVEEICFEIFGPKIGAKQKERVRQTIGTLRSEGRIETVGLIGRKALYQLRKGRM